MGKEYHERKPNRIKGFDYSTSRAYFLTICTKDRLPLLCKISRDNSVGAPIGRPVEETFISDKITVSVTEYGTIVDSAVKHITAVYPSVTLNNYVIMPDHIHILITLENSADQKEGRPMGAPTVSRIVNQFKGSVTKQIGHPVWQKLFYDHIIRNKDDFDECNKYIEDNPLRWIYKTTNK